MPNYYAHLIFGGAVLEALSPALRAQLEADPDVFRVGLLGPDPLFFHPKAQLRETGFSLHKRPVRPLAQRLREMAQASSLPHVRSYAAGFLCHFALDAAAHPEVARLVRASGLTHSNLEGELDRALMLEHGIDPLRQTPLPQFALPQDFDPLPAAVYGVTGAQFRAALADFCRVCHLQTKLSGTAPAALADLAAQRFPTLAPVRGVFLPRDPAPEGTYPAAVLRSVLEEAVEPTAAELEHFFDPAVPLGPWYGRPFDVT